MTRLKILFVFLLSSFSLFSGAAVGVQKVAFFTSIDLWNSGSVLFSNRYQYLLPKLEQQFRSEIPSEYDVIVKHGANQYDVWQTLHDPSVVAMIWYSHTAKDVIEDRARFDILPVFQEPHANFRFLGIIGCNSKYAINLLKEQGYLKNPKLVIKTYNKTFEASYTPTLLNNYLYELRKTLSTPAYQPPSSNNLVPQQGMKTLLITRYLPTSGKIHPAIRVEDYMTKVLGVFPPGQGGDFQKLTVKVPLNYKFDLTMKVGSSGDIVNGKLIAADLSLGDFEVKSQLPQDNWKLFQNSRGEAFGVVDYTFTYIK